MTVRQRVLTLAAAVLYLAAMVSTNGAFTMLDDECTIAAVATHPVAPTIWLFLSGGVQHEHPPLSDILLHYWLAATHDSLFWLRGFANFFYLAGALLIALASRRLAGPRAYWGALLLALLWPFSFQYGRIAGWYTFSWFLIALLTWLYLGVLEDRNGWLWAGFAVTGILLVWTNYFGVVIVILLVADFVLLHRQQAARDWWKLSLSVAGVALSFLPLLIGFASLYQSQHLGAPSNIHQELRNAVATLGYPGFSIFASTAVAPWYLPLSVPVSLAIVVLFIAVWLSAGRKWLVYYLLTMLVLLWSGHMSIKRVLFLLPWLFLAMTLAVFGERTRYRGWAAASLLAMLAAGWIGIASGRHYSSTNLYEPWELVAKTVAQDARRGSTIVSENISFFFYLNYQLGLQQETRLAAGPDLGYDLYRPHGFKIISPGDDQRWGQRLYGKVVVVNGSAWVDNVVAVTALNAELAQRCSKQGEFRAAPDPAERLKQNFAPAVPLLPYRTDVIWYDCPAQPR